MAKTTTDITTTTHQPNGAITITAAGNTITIPADYAERLNERVEQANASPALLSTDEGACNFCQTIIPVGGGIQQERSALRGGGHDFAHVRSTVDVAVTGHDHGREIRDSATVCVDLNGNPVAVTFKKILVGTPDADGFIG